MLNTSQLDRRKMRNHMHLEKIGNEANNEI